MLYHSEHNKENMYEKTNNEVYILKAIKNGCVEAIKNIDLYENKREISKLAEDDSTGKLHYLFYKYCKENRDYHLAKALLKNNKDCIEENYKEYCLVKDINEDVDYYWTVIGTPFMEIYIPLFVNDYKIYFSQYLFDTLCSLQLDDELERLHYTSDSKLVKKLYKYYEKNNNYEKMAKLYIHQYIFLKHMVDYEPFLKKVVSQTTNIFENYKYGPNNIKILFDYYSLILDNEGIAKYFVELLSFNWSFKINNVNNEILQLIANKINEKNIDKITNHLFMNECYLMNKNINNIDLHKIMISKYSSIDSLKYLFENNHDMEPYIDKLHLLHDSKHFIKLKDHSDIRYRVIYYEYDKNNFKNELFDYYFNQKKIFKNLLKDNENLENYKKYIEFKKKYIESLI